MFMNICSMFLFRRKRGERETAQDIIVRKLSTELKEELEDELKKTIDKFCDAKRRLDALRSKDCDEPAFKKLCQEVYEKEQAKQKEKADYDLWLAERQEKINLMNRKIPVKAKQPLPEPEAPIIEKVPEIVIKEEKPTEEKPNEVEAEKPLPKSGEEEPPVAVVSEPMEVDEVPQVEEELKPQETVPIEEEIPVVVEQDKKKDKLPKSPIKMSPTKMASPTKSASPARLASPGSLPSSPRFPSPIPMPSPAPLPSSPMSSVMSPVMSPVKSPFTPVNDDEYDSRATDEPVEAEQSSPEDGAIEEAEPESPETPEEEKPVPEEEPVTESNEEEIVAPPVKEVVVEANEVEVKQEDNIDEDSNVDVFPSETSKAASETNAAELVATDEVKNEAIEASADEAANEDEKLAAPTEDTQQADRTLRKSRRRSNITAAVTIAAAATGGKTRKTRSSVSKQAADVPDASVSIQSPGQVSVSSASGGKVDVKTESLAKSRSSSVDEEAAAASSSSNARPATPTRASTPPVPTPATSADNASGGDDESNDARSTVTEASQADEVDNKFRTFAKKLLTGLQRDTDQSIISPPPPGTIEGKGYESHVILKFDLATIKKRVEAGQVRTNAELKRDLMQLLANMVMCTPIMQTAMKAKIQQMRKTVLDMIEPHKSKGRRDRVSTRDRTSEVSLRIRTIEL